MTAYQDGKLNDRYGDPAGQPAETDQDRQRRAELARAGQQCFDLQPKEVEDDQAP